MNDKNVIFVWVVSHSCVELNQDKEYQPRQDVKSKNNNDPTSRMISHSDFS